MRFINESILTISLPSTRIKLAYPSSFSSPPPTSTPPTPTPPPPLPPPLPYFPFPWIFIFILHQGYAPSNLPLPAKALDIYVHIVYRESRENFSFLHVEWKTYVHMYIYLSNFHSLTLPVPSVFGFVRQTYTYILEKLNTTHILLHTIFFLTFFRPRYNSWLAKVFLLDML